VLRFIIAGSAVEKATEKLLFNPVNSFLSASNNELKNAGHRAGGAGRKIFCMP